MMISHCNFLRNWSALRVGETPGQAEADLLFREDIVEHLHEDR